MLRLDESILLKYTNNQSNLQIAYKFTNDTFSQN